MGPPAKEKKTFGQKCRDSWLHFKVLMYRPNVLDPNAKPGEKKFVTLYVGRTCESWAKIALFYVVFYGFLAGFFAALMAIFMHAFINDPSVGGPKLTQFIANQPGLSRVDKDLKERVQYPYIKNDSSVTAYGNLVTEYLKKFDRGNVSFCEKNKTDGYSGNAACKFDWRAELGPCASPNNSYGFAVGKPCFFVTINKVYGWVPKPLNADDYYLTLKCNGGTVHPKGFLLAAFPYRGQKDYVAPIVAVEIDVTKEKKTVTCEIEGKGIKVSDSPVESRAFGKIRFSDIEMRA